MNLEVSVPNWEYRLLAWAHEPLQSVPVAERIKADDHMLEAAYRYCDELTRFHSRTFYLASGLLPTGKRRAARALYAFCRVTDNLIDDNRNGAEALAQLESWKLLVSQPHHPSYEPVALAWADTRARYHIPVGYAEQLIRGVARDVTQKRYATFADLAEYSYGVASTVGLMAMHIIGYRGAEAFPYAVKLGVALQMTNILRDVAEDWRAGRVYLPQDELATFGLNDADVGAAVADDRWRAFMDFQIARNRQLYDESMPGIALLNPDGRFAIGAAAGLYQAILDEIEMRRGDVFSRRTSVSTVGKVRRLPGIWWRARQPSAVQYANPGS